MVLALPRLFLTGAATVHDVKDARSVILRYYESYPVSPAAGAPPPPFPFPAGGRRDAGAPPPSPAPGALEGRPPRPAAPRLPRSPTLPSRRTRPGG